MIGQLLQDYEAPEVTEILLAMTNHDFQILKPIKQFKLVKCRWLFMTR